MKSLFYRRQVPILAACVFGLLTSGTLRAQRSIAPTSASPPTTSAAPAPGYSLDDLVQIGLAQNPRLVQGAYSVTAAQARAYQAGLYPNPTVAFTLDELGDRTGQRGVNTLPLVTQEIVTGRKLTLNRAAAGKEVDQAGLALASQRATLLSGVRVAFFDLLVLQRRIELLGELTALADQSIAQTKKLLDAKQVARLDLVQLEVEAERLRTDQEAAERELPAAFRRLAAVVGVNRLPAKPLTGSLDAALPDYDLERLQQYILSVHPDRQSAVVGVERAKLVLRRAEVEPIPNVSLSAGYVRQNQNQSNDWTVGLSVPVPVWNRNQGNIRAAKAQIAESIQAIAVVENDLTERLATAFRDFAASKKRAERYKAAIMPRARETYDLSVKAYQGGQFEYLRVLEAQRSVAQANLDYIRALGEAWRAASVISGLTLEEEWPIAPSVATGQSPRPAGPAVDSLPMKK